MKFLDELNSLEDRVEQAMREALEAEIPASLPQDKPAVADQLYIVKICGNQFWFAYNKAAAINHYHYMPPFGSC